METFGQRFKRIRTARGLGQVDIASVCKNNKGEELTEAAISEWERDLGKPTFDNLIASAIKMGVSIDELVFGTKVPSRSSSIDLKHLADCIEILEETLPHKHWKIKAKDRAMAIVRLYKETPIEGGLPTAKVLELLRPLKAKYEGDVAWKKGLKDRSKN